MRILIALAICGCAWAQTRPQIGKMLDPNGAVRTVYGIASSVALGGAETTGVLSSACSNTFCLAKTESAIVSASGSVSAPEGPALFAFDGDAAWVWFPKSRQLARWQNPVGRLTCCQRGDFDGEVLSIGVNPVQFAVRRRNGVWIVNQDGSVAGSLPRSATSVMLIAGGAVYATEDEIVIRDVHLSLAGVTAISQMSGSYLQVRAGGIDYSLRTDPGREMLFQLPGVQQ